MPDEFAPEGELVDVQSREDDRRLAIDKVGVKDIQYPIVVKDRREGSQHTIASVDMFVRLPHHFKGTHMSRFLEVLAEYDHAFSVESLPDLLGKIRERLDSRAAHVELRFPYFMRKFAPVTGASALMDYRVRFLGDLDGSDYRLTLEVTVPVTTLCPCSKEIADFGAHNQRSQVKVAVRFTGFVWVEELIELVERNASCELYPILKRPDEKLVTEKAYLNPRFVEDMVRTVAAELDADPRIASFTVEAENFESIHNHSAYAFIARE
ncbi:MAG: GTP cyclohydrolase I FolE2 [Magnetococcales bacterium]|nr:GTP cyclohydrolase I FolE2 [Magnetococcales bacterium]